MPNDSHPTFDKKTLRPMLTTAIFNTAIAIVLSYLVLQDQAFVHVLIISQVMGLSICTFMVAAKRYGSQRGTVAATAASVVGMGAGVLTGSLVCWLMMYLLFGMDFREFLKDVFIYTLVFGIVFGVPVSYFFSSRARIQTAERKIQQEKIKRLTLEKEAAMTTLKLMQAQIEPHFLFNTLSNIISLLDVDMDQARKMLVDLNAYLRISLQRTRQEMVTLEQEFEFITRYLDIFKIRMGQRLSYEIHAEADHRAMAFPPMILQPIVENAVKYGLSPKPEGGRITIDCCTENDDLIITIADTGVGFGHSDGRDGIGLNNVSTRLETIYGHRARLTLSENQPAGVKAVIEVPL